ncbi:MAG: ATP-binding protein [Victivallales bacterium]
MEYSVKELVDLLFLMDEQERIEAKKASDIGKSVMETVCAFANEPGLGGGYLLLGVETAPGTKIGYRLVGLSDPDKLLNDLQTNCRSQFNVSLKIRTKSDMLKGKQVIAVYIPEAQPSLKPVYFKAKGLPQGAWRRGPNGDYSCTEHDLEEIYQARSLLDYDTTPLNDASLSDIDSEAVERYRKERAKVNPDAEELQWNDTDLLLSLKCLCKSGKKPKPTVAGILLFGKVSALRRLFPMFRVDYIRVPGREWVPEPDKRFDTVEMRDSMFRLITRASASVMDDLPKSFNLGEKDLQATEKPLLPHRLVRESIVNALMHPNCRKPSPVQIIRYSNRLEIRNAGYSLKPCEQLGEPGSCPRNPSIAAVLHETDFAETKGSGIRTMQKLMKEAELSPPLFESDRTGDRFTATYLFHHFLSPEDCKWLANFAKLKLSNEEAMALILVREIGAIDNQSLRNLTGIDALPASSSLQRLKKLGLLEQKGQARATYYVATPKLMSTLPPELGTLGAELGPLGQELVSLAGKKLGSLEKKVGSLGQELVSLGPKVVSLAPELVSLESLPDELKKLIGGLGKRLSQEKICHIIITLLKWKSLTKEDFGILLKRDSKLFWRRHLIPMKAQGLIEYTIPEMINHPRQAYRITEKGKRKLGGLEK